MRSRKIPHVLSRLGIAVGAVFFIGARLHAQVVAPPASEVPLPTKPATDSAKIKTDTLKAPIAVMSGVRIPEIGPEYRWRGNEIFATGAITLADLLERIPGITILRSGGMLSPQMPRLMGGLGRIKVYLDGVELDNLDRRSETLDLAWIPLWSLEEVSVDRSAGETRVNLRSQSSISTIPFTRTDVYTGDEDTNLYRGFYGKRFERGQVVQLGAEQTSTSSVRGGAGDKLSVMSRLGSANKKWSVDVFANRTHGTRDLQKPQTDGIPIPEYDATNTYAYLRFVAGNAAKGPWGAVIVSHLGVHESSPRTDSARAALNRIAADTVDSVRSERQILLRTGFTQPRFRGTLEDRIRNIEGKTFHDFVAAGQIFLSSATAGARVKRSVVGTSRAETWARFQPLSFLAFNLSAARNTPPDKRSPNYSPATPTFNFLQAEAGVRLFGPWLSAGIMTQDTLVAGAPAVFRQGFVGNASPSGKGTYGTLRGTFLHDFSVDLFAIKWDDEVFYRPKTQVRSELRFRTQWLSRFPKGEFELNSAITHNYSSRTFFRTATTSNSVDPAQHLDLLVEIRILRGIASYQLRNMTGYAYENLPGFVAQRALNLYGIRWEFWN
jgi:hypothetical protein